MLFKLMLLYKRIFVENEWEIAMRKTETFESRWAVSFFFFLYFLSFYFFTSIHLINDLNTVKRKTNGINEMFYVNILSLAMAK